MLRARLIIRWTVLAAILAILVGQFCARLQTVVSGSMAETLLGPHHRVTCADCGYEFACDADTTSEKAVCPNCGYPNAVPQRVFSGSRLVVDRTAFDWRPPRRWDVAVFNSPIAPAQSVVKRVAGVPGEQIEIRGGDVFADAKIVRKSLETLRSVAVLVHDTAFEPGRRTQVRPRWGAGDRSTWRREAGRYRLPLPAQTTIENGEPSPLDWLEYCNWRRLPDRPDQTVDGPIRDDDSYNAGESRRLNDVFDLLLVTRLTATGPGQLVWRAADGRQTFLVKLEPATGRVELSFDDGSSLQSVTLPAPLLTRETIVELALVDARVLFAIDGFVRLDYIYEPGSERRQATSRPVAIGASNLSVDIARLQLFRDVYYTAGPGRVATPAIALGAEQYFVLGDNSPVSDDSRTWPGAGVSLHNFIGKPLGIH